MTSDASDYLVLNDNVVPAPWTALWGILEAAGFNFSKVIAVGEGLFSTACYLMTSFNREGEVSPLAFVPNGSRFRYRDPTLAELSPPLTTGVNVLGADCAGVYPVRFASPGLPPAAAAFQARTYLINIGAREGVAPIQAPGLYAIVVQPPSAVPSPQAIGNFDALGTGGSGLFTVPTSLAGGEGQANGGTKARQLYFRGIASYNNHVFGWGYDANDEQIVAVTNITQANPGNVTAAAHGFSTGQTVLLRNVGGMAQVNGQSYVITVTGVNNFTLGVDTTGFGAYSALGQAILGNGDGPARVMFCNLGQPLKWGNDNKGQVGTDRSFTDSDAITLGDAGELIRGALVWDGKLFFGTNKGLHFIAGYGRDSFIADGATPVMRAFNVVGPRAMIEGPDKLLYGVSETGLWVFNGGGTPIPLFQQLRDFAGRSNGYWDQIWTDQTRSATAYPGKTNQDLVWMAVDWERLQVIIGIPWCSVANGFGFGSDTVILKYHVVTGGFTRQQFVGVQYTAAGYFRSQSQQAAMRLLGTPTAGASTVQRYGYKATNNASPVLPTRLPDVKFGPYTPWGPDGHGVVRRMYLVLAWDWPTLAVSAVTRANPAAVTTATPHGLSTGQVLEINGGGTMPQLTTSGPYTITVTGASTFTLGVDSSAWGAFAAGAAVTLPLAFSCKYINDGQNVLVLGAGLVSTFALSIRCAPPTTPQEGDLWLDVGLIDPNIGNAGAGSLFPAINGYLLRVRRDNAPATITGATKANPGVVTAPSHGFATGQRVSIRDVVGMTQLNNDAGAGPYTKDFTITVIDADHFSIGVDTSAFGVYTSGGKAALAWLLVPGLGMQGNRASIPIPIGRRDGTRVSLQLTATAITCRYQVEGFGMNPGEGEADV